MSDVLQNIFTLVGGVCGFIGVLLMANVYINESNLKAFLTLVSAFFGTQRAKTRVGTLRALPALAQDDRMRSLRGLGFVGLGFILQAMPPVVYLVNSIAYTLH
jgi:hypothetical protein